jgi:hypothetical protein
VFAQIYRAMCASRTVASISLWRRPSAIARASTGEQCRPPVHPKATVQIAFALAAVERDQEVEQTAGLVDKFLRFGLRHHVVADARVGAVERAQIRHEKRIRDERTARFGARAVFIAERDHRDRHA